MSSIKLYIFIQAFALVLLLTAAAICLYQYFRYLKIKRLYRSDYAKAIYLRNISKMLPFMPVHKSARYRKSESLIADSGMKISIESFYMVKTLLFVLGFAFFASVQTTNTMLQYENIISDLNIEKTIIDSVAAPSSEKLKLEKEIYNYSESCFSKDKAVYKELQKEKNSIMYIEYLEVQIREHYTELEEDAGIVAKRMYRKLIRTGMLENNFAKNILTLNMAFILYFLPNVICHIKLKLIEDKRDWEILNYIYVFSIFGRLPPFNIKNVLVNILVVADVYKLIINEALNGIKSGRGEASFDNLLQKVDNQELFELLETMRLAVSTGLLNIVESIDDMAINQLKWLEIKSIKRRKSKQVIAMIPVVLIMFIAVVYFSYSLSMLSNPMNFIK